MTSVLSVRELKKVIGKKTIVERISFDVGEGEVFGFLGPNGAGKTTTIRMLVGLIKPTEGSISIGGHDVRQEFRQAMRQIGSIVENPELYTYLTGWENLKQFARMLGDVTEERIHEIVRMVHLDQRIHDKVKTYSLGMKQRLGIAQALLGNPKLLILDEPTNGLDPAGIRELREFVHTLVKEQNISVFISSHLLSEVQMMCDRVAIINHGKMITVSTIDDLVKKAADKVEWTVTPVEEAEAILAAASEIKEVVRDGNKVACRMPIHLISTYNKLFVEKGIAVHSVREVVVTLEDLFMELTGGENIA
ncbi:ABC transporter ATP-binding protein [Ectobacillus panaciterrae]|uniref:ABC transporter ATP-binding protein n=1 Tax=Ectobacillus panaciterrae TaxID=363872 RepID=UPI000413524C|nr:ABC transporter ATP-binding protein [Ectobacillus panaciterrae]